MPDYGFQLYNNSGILLANDTDFNYGLVASGTITTPQNGSWIVNYSDTVEQPLVFIRNNAYVWVSANVTTTSTSFWGWEEIPSGSYNRRLSTSVVVSYKIFAPFKFLGNLSGQNYGIQVFDTNSKKTFDSNYEIPLIAGSLDSYLPVPSDSNAAPTSSLNLPSGVSDNPWFSISSISGANVGIHYPGSTINPNAILYRCARCIGGALQISYGSIVIGSFTTSTNVSGSNTYKKIYLINDVPAALDGTIGFVSGTTSCTYDPALTSACSTSQVYSMNYTGGNTNPVLFNWSLVNNTGSFSISGSTTSSSVTITKSGSGTSTYNATLQCVASQSGSVSITRTVAISSVHTSSANPLVPSITAGTGTGSCNYVSPSTSCTATRDYTVSTTGGDGTAKTYSWSLTNNTGGLSITTGTTGTGVTVSKTGAAGTYTATLQCVVTQSGTGFTATSALSFVITSSTPLTASMTRTTNNSSCSYYDNVASSCYSSEVWTVSTSGGNGNTKTYSWDFVSNPYGFSYSGSTTNTSATVGIDAVGTTTYTATIRCTVQQSGMSNATATAVISHSHTATASTCFKKGSRVLMADKSIKLIEDIQPGELVMGVSGPAKIIKIDKPKLGNRKLLKFTDDSLTWSEEHAMWVKDNSNHQWWWSYNPEMWKGEASGKVIGGLFDNSSLKTGPQVQWAHLDGWKSNIVEEIANTDPNTVLYLPFTNGSPIIVNGYVVGAGVNQWVYDYTVIDWNISRQEIIT